ncbi:unnamed protein product [Staurois parvus]|uniref:Uncharacterized protein n=1 Tax=Staurois parvus TaxID=386267 RepID=A0ABN9EXB9_9NEOB|nr:unnamed protein product [Staurois parvus]
MLSLVCIAREFFFLGRVHVISTGPISAVQTEGHRSCSLIGQLGENENSSYKLLPVLCWTLIEVTRLR